MVDKLHSYQGTVGQLHTIRDNVKTNWENWKENRNGITFPELVKEIMSKTKEEPEQKDYGYVHRKKTWWELVRLSTAVMGIEFSYAAITAFVSPILLSIGVPHTFMTLSWTISPILGFFLSPILGSLSDRCTLSYGRRRPFILFLSFFTIIGLMLVPNGKLLGRMFGGDVNFTYRISANETTINQNINDNERKTPSYYWSVAFTMLGLALADFTSDALQSPSRAYLLDLCNKDDHARGLSMFTILAGAGGTIGYFLGSIDWDNSLIGNAFGGHVRAVFTIITVLFIICIIITVTTFDEVPLEKLDILDLKAMEVNSVETPPPNYETIDTKGYIKHTGCMSFDPPASYSTLSQTGSPLHHNQVENKEKSNGDILLPSSPTHTMKKQSIDVETDEIAPPSLKDYLLSIVQMPFSLKILFLTNLLCWMSHVSYSLYFTDFVGETVFGGNPRAPPGSESRNLYQAGIRFACIGMSVYSASCLFNSLVIEYLINRFGLRNVYTANLLIDCVAQFLLFMFSNKTSVIVLSWASGVMYCTIFTIPYILIARYHTLNVFEIDTEGNHVISKQIRGMGTDISIIGSCVFSAQFILSVFMGEFVSIATTKMVPLTSAIVAGLASFVATKVIYLDL